MATINQTQRNYFIDDIKSKFNKAIGRIKAKIASKVADLAISKYNEFLDDMNIREDLDALKMAEDALRLADDKLTGVKNALQLESDINTHAYKNNSPKWHHYHNSYFKEYCRQHAEVAFYETKSCEELAIIEQAKDQAIRTIMLHGANVDQLQENLTKLLSTCGITLLEA